MPFQKRVKKKKRRKLLQTNTHKQYSKNTAWKFFFFQSKTCHVNHALFVVIFFKCL